MSPQSSDSLQHELAKLLAKSRRLRGQSAELNEEIQRLTRLIAGVTPSDPPVPADRADDRETPPPSPRFPATPEPRPMLSPNGRRARRTPPPETPPLRVDPDSETVAPEEC